jgi:type IV pilus assembly protein PilB
MNSDSLSINPAVLGLVPKETCRKHMLVPLDRIEHTLIVAIADPRNMFALDDVKFMTGYEVVPVDASEAAILAAIESLPDTSGSDGDLLETPGTDSAKESPVIAIVNRILMDAIAQDATDVHLQPAANGLRVSFRIDGFVRHVALLPPSATDAITVRLKIMAMLDIAEKRLPQDGRIALALPNGLEETFRIATVPTIQGERIGLRRMVERPRMAIDALGFSPEALDRLVRAIHLPSGLVIIAGPSRSGRSTTLYAIVDALNTGARNILTAEETPICPLEGVGQVVARPAMGVTLAAVLRGIAHQDPDLIMLSRIPDAATAEIALELASSGVAVVSSIDAEGAPQALLTLAALGCPPALLASTVRCVLAQRLVRRLCERCRAEAPLSDEQLVSLTAAGIDVPPGARFRQAPGCPACRHTGYRGRVAIAEVLTCSDEVKAALLRGDSAQDLRAAAIGDGLLTFASQTMAAALAGETTIDECLRAIGDTQSP